MRPCSLAPSGAAWSPHGHTTWDWRHGVFATIDEAAARWGCHPADIAGWSIAGHIEISTGIPPVVCGDDTISGMVGIPAADILPMFRRCGSGPRAAVIRRVREPGTDEWRMISDPPEGVPVDAADVVVTASEFTRFEDEHALFRRPGRAPAPRTSTIGTR